MPQRNHQQVATLLPMSLFPPTYTIWNNVSLFPDISVFFPAFLSVALWFFPFYPPGFITHCVIVLSLYFISFLFWNTFLFCSVLSLFFFLLITCVFVAFLPLSFWFEQLNLIMSFFKNQGIKGQQALLNLKKWLFHVHFSPKLLRLHIK